MKNLVLLAQFTNIIFKQIDQLYLLDTIDIKFDGFKIMTFNNINNIYIKLIKHFENLDFKYCYTNLFRYFKCINRQQISFFLFFILIFFISFISFM